MRSPFTSTLIVACVVAGTAASVFGQAATRNAGGGAYQCMRHLTQADWKIFLDNIKTTNPYAATRFETEPEFRKEQENNIRQVLAFACQAVQDGVLQDPVNRQELENIRAEITAVQYDKAAHKQEGVPPFSSISAERIAGFYKLVANETRFDEFLKVKVELLKRGTPSAPDRAISPEEREQAKDIFAKIKLSEAESKLKARRLYPHLGAPTALQVKLQQAQFLSRLYAETIADQITATDEEIAEYIAAHPELDSSAKRSKAQGILKRAAAGEEFAALANEYTEDPGNAGPQGKSGGLYKDVPKGQMIRAFEQAALALEPGQVAPGLVETEYGYHVIKLERKGGTPETYDVRHILIGTMVKDPENPGGRDIPVQTFVRTKLEAEKESLIVAKIVADNKIDIAPVVAGGTQVVKRRPIKRRQAGRK